MTKNDLKEKFLKISSKNLDLFINTSKVNNLDLSISDEEEGLKISALLYIAANMPILEEKNSYKKENRGCAFCNNDKNSQTLIDYSFGFSQVELNKGEKAITLYRLEPNFDPEKKYAVGSFPIAFCPVCGKKL